MALLQRSQINNLLQEIRNLRWLVVGDCMLDHYIFRDAHRISPEAPVPVVQVEGEFYRLGGACNVAANIRQLGAQVKLMGGIGSDKEGVILRDLLGQAGIEFDLPSEPTDVQTIVKTRVLVRNQQLCRLDKESAFPVDFASQLARELDANVENVDGVIVSDYGKGTIQQIILDHLVRLKAKKHFFLAIDPKPVHTLNYSGADLLTPNRGEALQLAAMHLSHQQEISIEELAKKIFAAYDIQHLAITLSGKGIAMISPDLVVKRFPTLAREVFDVSGAGDTAIAALALALCTCNDVSQAAYFANLAAGVVVGKVGTASVSADEILAYVDAF